MSWSSIREYTQRYNLSPSTVRRHIQQGRIQARKFGRNWYVQFPEKGDGGMGVSDPMRSSSVSSSATLATNDFASSSGDLQSVVEFSSKALHHYLLLSEKLVQEKELRLQEKEVELRERRQEVAELEAYVKLLESEIERHKEKPEGWS